MAASPAFARAAKISSPVGVFPISNSLPCWKIPGPAESVAIGGPCKGLNLSIEKTCPIGVLLKPDITPSLNPAPPYIPARPEPMVAVAPAVKALPTACSKLSPCINPPMPAPTAAPALGPIIGANTTAPAIVNTGLATFRITSPTLSNISFKKNSGKPVSGFIEFARDPTTYLSGSSIPMSFK